MGLFSGFNINPFKNQSTLGGFATGGIYGAMLGNKNRQNAKIDAEIAANNSGGPPAMLNPNQMPGQSAGLSSYGQLHRQLNSADARLAGQQAQAGAMGDTSQARSDLAARGGLSSGASERIARGGMADAANARQGNAYGLMRQNLASDTQDIGNQQNWAQTAHLSNQQMQGQIYGGNQMANATLNANRPKGLLGMGFLGL